MKFPPKPQPDRFPWWAVAVMAATVAIHFLIWWVKT